MIRVSYNLSVTAWRATLGARSEWKMMEATQVLYPHQKLQRALISTSVAPHVFQGSEQNHNTEWLSDSIILAACKRVGSSGWDIQPAARMRLKFSLPMTTGKTIWNFESSGASTSGIPSPTCPHILRLALQIQRSLRTTGLAIKWYNRPSETCVSMKNQRLELPR